jgi:DNA-binding MarR family transcriptional regulator
VTTAPAAVPAPVPPGPTPQAAVTREGPAEPRHPDSDAQRTMRAFLTAARLLSEQLGQELRKEGGMSQIHYEILAHLADVPGEHLRMSDLARRTGVSVSRLSHLVQRLEDRGWAVRHGSATDGRVHLARVTPEGRTALERAAPWHAGCAETRLLDHLTPQELEQLRRISETLAGRLAGTPARPPPAG